MHQHSEFRLDDAVSLPARVSLPAGAIGVVVFAHGSAGARHSPRHHRVAAAMHEARLGTVLLDLLTDAEEREDLHSGSLRFDIPLLASRLGAVTDLVADGSAMRGLPLGYFGSGTGSAAAMVAAVARPGHVCAVVSRGGRPDLADGAPRRLRAPTLLVVGGNDTEVLAINRATLRDLQGPARLEIVPGATHLFDEPGALDCVARLASQWFAEHLGRVDASALPVA